MNAARAHVLGPLACDRVYHVDRLPGHDEKAFAKAYRDVVGGPPLWVAVHLAQWGIPVTLYSAVGDDEAGRIVMADLDGRGIDTSGIVRPEGLRTATPVVIVDRTGERAIIIDALPEAALLRIGEGLEPRAGDWVISNLFHPDPVRAAVSRAQGRWRRDPDRPRTPRGRAGRIRPGDGSRGRRGCPLHQRAVPVVVAAARPCGPDCHGGHVRAGACRRPSDRRRHAGRGRCSRRAMAAWCPVCRRPPVAAINTTAAGDTFAASFVRARLDGASDRSGDAGWSGRGQPFRGRRAHRLERGDRNGRDTGDPPSRRVGPAMTDLAQADQRGACGGVPRRCAGRGDRRHAA